MFGESPREIMMGIIAAKQNSSHRLRPGTGAMMNSLKHVGLWVFLLGILWFVDLLKQLVI